MITGLAKSSLLSFILPLYELCGVILGDIPACLSKTDGNEPLEAS